MRPAVVFSSRSRVLASVMLLPLHDAPNPALRNRRYRDRTSAGICADLAGRRAASPNDTPYYITRTRRSDRRPLRSFVRPCAARGWWRSGGWCSPSASG